MMGGMEVLVSRNLLRPIQLHRSHRFYRDTLGLAIYREFGGDDAPGIVFFLGNGLLESAAGRRTHRGMRSRCGCRSETLEPSTDACWTPG
jgi:catechol 2,3-dioxygenase-like lactoylglutathione lyase family enzyme